jgi:hypothetical protein
MLKVKAMGRRKTRGSPNKTKNDEETRKLNFFVI